MRRLTLNIKIYIFSGCPPPSQTLRLRRPARLRGRLGRDRRGRPQQGRRGAEAAVQVHVHRRSRVVAGPSPERGEEHDQGRSGDGPGVVRRRQSRGVDLREYRPGSADGHADMVDGRGDRGSAESATRARDRAQAL